MLHSPTAVIAAVLADPAMRYDVSMAYCTASPKAPPAGTPLEIAKAAWLTCCDGQYFSPGVAAMKGKP